MSLHPESLLTCPLFTTETHSSILSFPTTIVSGSFAHPRPGPVQASVAIGVNPFHKQFLLDPEPPLILFPMQELMTPN